MVNRIANLLRMKRKERKMSAKSVTDALAEYGIAISPKTLYGWEGGFRQPDADTFLVLCEIFGIQSFSEIPPVNDDTIPEDTSQALTDSEKVLLKSFRELNTEGQETLLRHAEDLVDTGKYKKPTAFPDSA